MVYESVNHCEIVVDLLNTLRTPKYYFFKHPLTGFSAFDST